MYAPIHPRSAGVKCIAFILTTLTFTVLSAQAEQTYISDVLVVNIRDNFEFPYTVVGRVTSNDPVTVVEEKNKHVLIETNDGKRGWIASQYITSESPKSLRIEHLEQQIDDMKKELDILEPGEGTTNNSETTNQDSSEYERLKVERDTLAAEVEKLRQSAAVTEPPTDTASLATDFKQLQSDYASLLEQKNSLDQQLVDINAGASQAVPSLLEGGINQPEIHKLSEKKSIIYWLLAGVAIFLCGVLSGKLTGRRRKRLSF
jgi:SH3 domain protein